MLSLIDLKASMGFTVDFDCAKSVLVKVWDALRLFALVRFIMSSDDLGQFF